MSDRLRVARNACVTMTPVTVRLGAYVLTGDPTWLRSSLVRTYRYLTDLVVLVPEDGLGWAGRPIPVDQCVAAVRELDTRGIARFVSGRWTDPADPLAADSAQRRDGVAALRDSVDWVVQLDNDEIMPDLSRALELVPVAEERGLGAIEWPMRCLYRRLAGNQFLEVCARNGAARFDYPGPILVRSCSRPILSRRVPGGFLRAVVAGDDQSAELAKPPLPEEVRVDLVDLADVIWHNAWGREPDVIRRKTRTWGHAFDRRWSTYYYGRWLPSPLLWRRQRNLHPLFPDAWPRLRPVEVPAGLIVAADRLE